MILEFFLPDDDDIYEWLGEHDICRDDYDYVIFSECTPNNARKVILMMKDHLLKGCCSNECTYVEDFFGKDGILGMAYHS